MVAANARSRLWRVREETPRFEGKPVLARTLKRPAGNNPGDIMRRTTLSDTLCFAALFFNACALEKADDAAEYRQVLPKADAIRVAGPEAGDAAAKARAGSGTGSGLLAAGAAAPESNAFWYVFSRETRDNINAVTADVLGSVWLIVHTEPTSLRASSAVWGPYTNALDPVTYRFTVTRVDAAERKYSYELVGRPKGSSSDEDYVAVLRGAGYGPLSEQHGDGAFSIDLDALRVLDPAKHGGEFGKVTIEHELPRKITRTLGALPRTIEARAEGAGDVWFAVESQANVDGTGSLIVDSHGDIDASKTTLLEDVHVVSRWRSTGAGRADIAITSGDLPPAIPLVTAVECWNADFSRAHYSDSVGFEPVMGDPSACAYPDAAAP
jgi:hypothetical protein